jgi:hypothetical protein
MTRPSDDGLDLDAVAILPFRGIRGNISSQVNHLLPIALTSVDEACC